LIHKGKIVAAGKHVALAAELEKNILSGKYGTEGGLPSASELAQKWNMSINTVKAALALLEGKDLVEKRGLGYYVNKILRVSTAVVPPFEEVLATNGFEPFVRNITEPEVTTMSVEVAAMFGQPVGLLVVHRYRVQGRDGKPFRLSEYWFPEHLARPYLQHLKDNPGYDILEDIKADLNITRQKVHDDVSARNPTESEADLLSILPDIAVLEVRRTNRTLDDVVLMHHKIVFVGSLSILSYDYEIDNRLPLKSRASQQDKEKE
jgi:DNA-binding GntR family transcriptional regulator